MPATACRDPLKVVDSSLLEQVPYVDDQGGEKAEPDPEKHLSPTAHISGRGAGLPDHGSDLLDQLGHGHLLVSVGLGSRK